MSNYLNDKSLIAGYQQSESDKIGAQVDAELIALGSRSASLFTAGELQYLAYRTSKLRFFTTAEQEQRLLDEVLKFKARIDERAKRISDPLALMLELETTKESLAEKMRMIDSFYLIVNKLPKETRDAVFEAIAATGKDAAD